MKYFTARVVDRYPGDRTGERQQVDLRALRTLPKVDIHLGHFRADVKWRTLADREFDPIELFTPRFRPAWLYRLLWRDQVGRRTEPATSARVMLYEEKGSDVNLGVNLVHDAATSAMSKAIVITNDSDLEEAIHLARSSGIQVGIVNPHRSATNKRLKKAADFEIPLRCKILAQCQFDEHLTTNKGRQVEFGDGTFPHQHRPLASMRADSAVLSRGPRPRRLASEAAWSCVRLSRSSTPKTNGSRRGRVVAPQVFM